jgi:hypothetical protein
MAYSFKPIITNEGIEPPKKPATFPVAPIPKPHTPKPAAEQELSTQAPAVLTKTAVAPTPALSPAPAAPALTPRTMSHIEGTSLDEPDDPGDDPTDGGSSGGGTSGSGSTSDGTSETGTDGGNIVAPEELGEGAGTWEAPEPSDSPSDSSPAPAPSGIYRTDPATGATITFQGTWSALRWDAARELSGLMGGYFDQMDELLDEYLGAASIHAGSYNAIIDQFMPGISALLAQIGAGPGQYEDEAQNIIARLFGFANSTEYNEYLNQLLLESDIENQIGFSDAERAERERAMLSTIAMQERQARDQLEAISQEWGSVTRTLAAADGFRAQIADQRMQMTVQTAQEDYARRLAQADRALKHYEMMVAAGTQSALQVMQMHQQATEAALTGYVQAMSVNLEAVKMLSDLDYQKFMASMDAVYKSATLALGIHEQEISDAETAYNEELARYNMEMQRAQQNAQAGTVVLSVIAAIVIAIILKI